MTLAQSVQDALAGQDDPVLARVHVNTNQNTVILSGYVKKIRQSDTAEQIARQVPGVQNVVNNLIVRQ
jgi:hyperosmotically inducible periplasmic protein